MQCLSDKIIVKFSRSQEQLCNVNNEVYKDQKKFHTSQVQGLFYTKIRV